MLTELIYMDLKASEVESLLTVDMSPLPKHKSEIKIRVPDSEIILHGRVLKTRRFINPPKDSKGNRLVQARVTVEDLPESVRLERQIESPTIAQYVRGR